jgi:hypothetical protein
MKLHTRQSSLIGPYPCCYLGLAAANASSKISGPAQASVVIEHRALSNQIRARRPQAPCSPNPEQPSLSSRPVFNDAPYAPSSQDSTTFEIDLRTTSTTLALPVVDLATSNPHFRPIRIARIAITTAGFSPFPSSDCDEKRAFACISRRFTYTQSWLEQRIDARAQQRAPQSPRGKIRR